jgi:hypothetical protein
MTTSTVAPEIVAFARGVRAALADLPPEEVDDLTEGLEADLTESLAEDLRRTLPDPVAYAAELRTAAGLPGRPATKQRPLGGLFDVWQSMRAQLADAVSASPPLTDLGQFLVSLRPVWWVARGLVATWVVALFLGGPMGIFGPFWFVLIGAVVVSVQWGRGQWGFPGVRRIVMVGNVLAVLAIPILWSAGWWGSQPAPYDASAEDSAPGLYLDGERLTNIYAYDSAGKPLTGIQLFDQDGRPLDPFGLSEGDGQPCAVDDCTSLYVPSRLVTGQSVFNIFPLDAVQAAVDEMTEQEAPVPGATPSAPPAPFVQVPAVQAPQEVAQPNQ